MQKLGLVPWYRQSSTRRQRIDEEAGSLAPVGAVVAAAADPAPAADTAAVADPATVAEVLASPTDAGTVAAAVAP